MQFKEFIIKMLSHQGQISSKRVCGTIGWIVALGIVIYCTIMVIQAPICLEYIVYASTALMGIDSITGVFKKKTNGEETNSQSSEEK